MPYMCYHAAIWGTSILPLLLDRHYDQSCKAWRCKTELQREEHRLHHQSLAPTCRFENLRSR